MFGQVTGTCEDHSLAGLLVRSLHRAATIGLLLMQVVMLYLRFKAPFQSVETT
jgi:hypothetical protein